MEAALGGVGLSTAKFNVLTQLLDDSLPLRELAARLTCVRSNITQLVDRLEADGLVRRVDDPSDRRSILAEITPTGRERQHAGAALLARAEVDLLAALGPERSALLTQLLAGLK